MHTSHHMKADVTQGGENEGADGIAYSVKTQVRLCRGERSVTN